MQNKITIISTNPEKISPAKEAIKRLFSNSSIEVISTEQAKANQDEIKKINS